MKKCYEDMKPPKGKKHHSHRHEDAHVAPRKGGWAEAYLKGQLDHAVVTVARSAPSTGSGWSSRYLTNNA